MGCLHTRGRAIAATASAASISRNPLTLSSLCADSSLTRAYSACSPALSLPAVANFFSSSLNSRSRCFASASFCLSLASSCLVWASSCLTWACMGLTEV